VHPLRIDEESPFAGAGRKGKTEMITNALV
jgi:hypothetical protein